MTPLPAPASFIARLRARFGGLKYRPRPRIGSLTPRQLLALHLMATIGPAIRTADDAGSKYRIGNSGHLFQESTFKALVANGYARTAYGRSIAASLVPTLHGRRTVLAAARFFILPLPGRLPPAGIFF